MDENLAYWSASFLTSRKMVLLVPRPWYRRCCRHSWQAVLWQTLHRDRIICHHPSYSMWAHNPQFHRIETWLLSPTLWYSVRYQTHCLCLMLWTPFHFPLSTSNACLSTWDFSCVLLFSRCTSLSLNSKDTLYPIPLDNLGWLTLCRSDPLSLPPTYS